MVIQLTEIPEEGLHRQGVLPDSIFELSSEDCIRPDGEILYDVTIYLFDGVVTFAGSLQSRFQLQCNTCNEYLPFDANFSSWSSELDLEDGQSSFDLVKVIREDFLLDLPSHSRCDEWIEDRSCPKAHFVVEEQKPLEEEAQPGDQSDAWGALDQLS